MAAVQANLETVNSSLAAANEKCASLEVDLRAWKSDEKRIQFCSVSPILLFEYFEQGRRQRLLKIFAPYVTVYGHTRTKMILAATRFEKSKNEDGALITETDELSDEIFFDFRFGYFQLPVSEKTTNFRF